MEDAWKLDNITDINNYFEGVAFLLETFQSTDHCDHVHCDLCWDKISEYPGDFHRGYHATTQNNWICETCARDFKDSLKVHLIPSPDSLQ